MKYRIELIGDTGTTIAENYADTKREAVTRARYMLTDEYAQRVESSHFHLGTERTRVFNAAGECVEDFVYKPADAARRAVNEAVRIEARDGQTLRFAGMIEGRDQLEALIVRLRTEFAKI